MGRNLLSHDIEVGGQWAVVGAVVGAVGLGGWDVVV